MTTTGIKGQLHFGAREKRAVPVMVILQAGAAIGGTLIKGINALVDAKREKSFNNVLKMVAANVELTHRRLRTLENKMSMIAKAIMPALDDLKSRIALTNCTHSLTIHHFVLLIFKNYLTIEVGTLQRIHHQYNMNQQ